MDQPQFADILRFVRSGLRREDTTFISAPLTNGQFYRAGKRYDAPVLSGNPPKKMAGLFRTIFKASALAEAKRERQMNPVLELPDQGADFSRLFTDPDSKPAQALIRWLFKVGIPAVRYESSTGKDPHQIYKDYLTEVIYGDGAKKAVTLISKVHGLTPAGVYLLVNKFQTSLMSIAKRDPLVQKLLIDLSHENDYKQTATSVYDRYSDNEEMSRYAFAQEGKELLEFVGGKRMIEQKLDTSHVFPDTNGFVFQLNEPRRTPSGMVDFVRVVCKEPQGCVMKMYLYTKG
jgi:hypothetical protein